MMPTACLNPDTILEYLYDEADADARRRTEAHVRQCTTCAAELAALLGVQNDLKAWSPPERRLGFRIVGTEEVPSLRRRWLPALGLAAAAVLVMAAAAAVAQIEVRHGPDGLTVRTGRVSREAEVRPAPELPVTAADLVVLERRLQTEIARTRREAAVVSGSGLRGSRPMMVRSDPPVASTGGEEQLLRQVRRLILESEQRQQRELALRVAQLARDVDVQRQGDFVRIQQGLGRLEGVTGAEVARQRELLNYLVRVSQR